MKILLLEDDIALSKAIKKALELKNHNVDVYFDGEEVYALIENIDSLNYDLYIFDINVPNKSGLELLKTINTYKSSIKVIIITAKNDEYSLRKAYDYGCVDYINKPFHLVELQIKVDKINKSLNPDFSIFKLKDKCSLTKKEKQFLHLLYEKKTISYQDIETNLYSNKNMSMDALRSLVKRLRAKLQENYILNLMDEGYKLNQFNK